MRWVCSLAWMWVSVAGCWQLWRRCPLLASMTLVNQVFFFDHVLVTLI